MPDGSVVPVDYKEIKGRQEPEINLVTLDLANVDFFIENHSLQEDATASEPGRATFCAWLYSALKDFTGLARAARMV